MLYLDPEKIYNFLAKNRPTLLRDLEMTEFLFRNKDQQRVSRILWKNNDHTVCINWNYEKCHSQTARERHLKGEFRIVLDEFIEEISDVRALVSQDNPDQQSLFEA